MLVLFVSSGISRDLHGARRVVNTKQVNVVADGGEPSDSPLTAQHTHMHIQAETAKEEGAEPWEGEHSVQRN